MFGGNERRPGRSEAEIRGLLAYPQRQCATDRELGAGSDPARRIKISDGSVQVDPALAYARLPGVKTHVVDAATKSFSW
jgi:hypothetical protein